MKLQSIWGVVFVLILVVGTRPALGTKFIPTDPDIGTWDPVTRIYTLTACDSDSNWPLRGEK